MSCQTCIDAGWQCDALGCETAAVLRRELRHARKQRDDATAALAIMQESYVRARRAAARGTEDDNGTR